MYKNGTCSQSSSIFLRTETTNTEIEFSNESQFHWHTILIHCSTYWSSGSSHTKIFMEFSLQWSFVARYWSLMTTQLQSISFQFDKIIIISALSEKIVFPENTDSLPTSSPVRKLIEVWSRASGFKNRQKRKSSVKWTHS